MLDPRRYLDHADRLMTADANAEVDVRRAVSATCYALFHLLTGAAASCLAGEATPLHDRIRRGIDHRDLRKLCDAITSSKGSVPKVLEGLLEHAPSDLLLGVASAFSRLQDARHIADYDLNVTPTLKAARSSLALARAAFHDWIATHTHPEAQVFLAAILLSDRWTRRG